MIRLLTGIFSLALLITACSSDSGNGTDAGNQNSSIEENEEGSQDPSTDDRDVPSCPDGAKLDTYGLEPGEQWLFYKDSKEALSRTTDPFARGLIFSSIAGKFLSEDQRKTVLIQFVEEAKQVFFDAGTGSLYSADNYDQLREASCASQK